MTASKARNRADPKDEIVEIVNCEADIGFDLMPAPTVRSFVYLLWNRAWLMSGQNS
jgi:hypothetical protein